MNIIIKLSKFGDVIPNFITFGMKNVGTILMNFDTSFLICVRIGIASKMRATINN